jgi:2-keto-4-pentenoate hydratase
MDEEGRAAASAAAASAAASPLSAGALSAGPVSAGPVSAGPVSAGMRALLARRSAELGSGATDVGWKIGFNTPAIQQHFGLTTPVVGYLCSNTVRSADIPVDLSGWERPALEVEVAITVGADGSVAALAPALELVDLDLPFDRIEPILAGNVFHRGVIFGSEVPGADVRDLAVSVVKAGELVADGRLVEEPATTVEVVTIFLEQHGARLLAGHRIIAGSMIPPLTIAPGDQLEVSFGVLGSIAVTFC